MNSNSNGEIMPKKRRGSNKIISFSSAKAVIAKRIKEKSDDFVKLQQAIAEEFKNEMNISISKNGRYVAAGNYNEIANRAARNFLNKWCGIE